MHSQSISAFEHSHVFLGAQHDRNERRTLVVVGLTAAMMVAEIVGGSIFGSMALVADGWHMSTHAAALGIAALAYRFARAHREDRRFSFGTGKLGELAAFASAIILAMIALYIGTESAHRLLSPVPIAFGEAIPIAALGFCVNLASVWLLHGDDEHAHHHHHPGSAAHQVDEDEHDDDDHDHHDARDHHALDHHAHDHHGAHGHHDTNLRAAYVHVLADALTSVLAIVALTAGRFLGWTWLDPVMGLVGTLVIAAWSFGLIRSAGAVLLDFVPNEKITARVRTAIEQDGDRITDLHLWRLGPGHSSLILSVVSDHPRPPDVYKARLAGLPGLSHITVEVNACPGHAASVAPEPAVFARSH
jgi:cation diffusion facilitator family transporter